jgi:adenylate cyclase class 2
MYEVELKLRADHDRVRERLADHGADRIDAVTQEDTYYDAPDRDFAETDEALRVRRETDEDTRVVLTYKGPLVDSASKTREEAQTRVADGEAIEAILAGLGYEPAATVRKERENYALEDCTVTLDRVEGLGEFVEVEREAAKADIDDARRDAVAVLERLGLDPDDQIRTSYLELLQ